jgi:hypothetical protein
LLRIALLGGASAFATDVATAQVVSNNGAIVGSGTQTDDGFTNLNGTQGTNADNSVANTGSLASSASATNRTAQGLRGSITPDEPAADGPLPSAVPVASTGAIDTSGFSDAAGSIANAAGPDGPLETGDLYQPTPLRLGMFDVSGDLTLTYGASTNPNGVGGGTSGRFSSAVFTGSAVTDWSRHQLRLGSRANADLTRAGQGRNDIDLDLDAALRLDLADETSVTLGATYGVSTEEASSPDAFITGTDNPLFSEYGLSATLDRNAGLVGLQLRGELSAERYAPIEIAGLPAVSQQSRDRNGLALGGRLIWNGGAVVRPYVDLEYEIGSRVTALDANGFDRAFKGMRGAVGADFNFSDKLNGTFEVGYGKRDYADANLSDLSGILVSGALNWSPTERLTTNLTASSGFEGQSRAGVSGSVNYQLTSSVNWQAMDNLDLGLTAGVRRTNYSNAEHDTEYSIGANASYWFNPYVGLTGQVARTELKTNRIGAAYSANSVELGLRLRH